MKAAVTIFVWVATVGTVLVIADDLLALYKIIQFRAAIPSASEFALIVTMYAAIGISAILILLAVAVRSTTRAPVLARIFHE